MIPLGASDISTAIKNIADVYLLVRADLNDQRVRSAIARTFDEMLRNPRFPYRRTETFAQIIGDRSPGLTVTRDMLTRMITAGVSGAIGPGDLWVRRHNWILDGRGHVQRNDHGEGILRPGVTRGHL